MKYLKLTPK